jgi:hypothetical protein
MVDVNGPKGSPSGSNNATSTGQHYPPTHLFITCLSICLHAYIVHSKTNVGKNNVTPIVSIWATILLSMWGTLNLII